MVWDATGVLLFLVWLVLPPLYVVLLGRHYVRRCADAAQRAVWALEELQEALEDLPAAQEPNEPSEDALPTVPPAREYREEDTSEFGALSPESDQTGRHRLDRSPLIAHAFSSGS